MSVGRHGKQASKKSAGMAGYEPTSLPGPHSPCSSYCNHLKFKAVLREVNCVLSTSANTADHDGSSYSLDLYNLE